MGKTVLWMRNNDAFPICLFLDELMTVYTLRDNDMYWLDLICNVKNLDDTFWRNIKNLDDTLVTWKDQCRLRLEGKHGCLNRLNSINDLWIQFLDDYTEEELSTVDVKLFMDKFLQTTKYKKLKRMLRKLNIDMNDRHVDLVSYDNDGCRSVDNGNNCVIS